MCCSKTLRHIGLNYTKLSSTGFEDQQNSPLVQLISQSNNSWLAASENSRLF